MTRREFMNILDRAMLGMDYDEKRGILNDYDEHFQIAMQEGKSEEEIIKDLGNPNEIAKNYMQRANIAQNSDYEEGSTVDISSFNAINNDTNSEKQPANTPLPQNTGTSDGNVYIYSIADVENVSAELSISNIEIVPQEPDQDDKLIKIELIYPAMMNENLEQYRITVERSGNSVNIKQKKRIMNFLNHFVLKEIPLVRISIPKQSKLNLLSVSTERGNIDAADATAYTLNMNNISGYINANSIKGIETKIASVSGSLKIDGLVSDVTKVTTVSGGVKLNETVANRVYINNVSGQTDVSVKASSIECHNVSGKATVEVLSDYDYAKMNSVSGSVDIYVLDNRSFNASYNSVSGSFSTYFGEITGKNKNGSFKYSAQGDSAKKPADIHLSTVSGHMAVKKTSAK